MYFFIAFLKFEAKKDIVETKTKSYNITLGKTCTKTKSYNITQGKTCTNLSYSTHTQRKKKEFLSPVLILS